MDSRWYFVLGDLFSNLLVGAIAGWLCVLVVGEGWNMVLAMLLAMAIGMLVGLFLWPPLAVLFGAMEVMVPIMFSGMVSGMFLGMAATMRPIGHLEALQTGALYGLGSLVFIWILNSFMRGARRYGTEA